MRSRRYWGAVARTARIAVPVVVAAAALQTLLFALASTPGLDLPFLAVAVAAVVVAALAVWAIAVVAVGAVEQRPPRWRAAALGWCVLAVVAATASTAVLAPLGAVVAVAGALVVAASAAGRWPRRSWAIALWALGALAAIALVVLVDLLVGFFVAGTSAAFLANLAAGVIAVLVLVGAAQLVTPVAAAEPTTAERLA